MGHSIFLQFYFMTHMIYVIVFVLRNHYVAGENNRMRHHRSLTFLKFDFMTHMSHSDYKVIDFNYVTNIMWKGHLIRAKHVKTMHTIG